MGLGNPNFESSYEQCEKRSLKETLKLISEIEKNSNGELEKAEALYDKGFVNFKLEDYIEALKNFNESIKTIDTIVETNETAKEKLVDDFFYKGRTHFKLGEYDEALVAFNNSIEIINKINAQENHTKSILLINIRTAEMLNNKGFIYFKLGDYKEALGLFQESINKISQNYEIITVENKHNGMAKKILIDAKFSKGLTLLKLGRYVEALNQFNELICEYENKPEYLTDSEDTVISNWTNEWLSSSSKKNYKEDLEAVNKLIIKLENKEFDIIYWKTLVAAWISKGRIYDKFDMLPAAKECFKKALEVNPKDIPATTDLALLFAEEGDLSRAKKIFEKIIQYDPNFSLGHAYLAEIFLKTGSIRKASEEIMIALYIEKHNNNPNIFHLAHIHFLDGQIKIENKVNNKEKEYSESIKAFENAISLDVGNPKYLLWSIYAKYLCHKFETNVEMISKSSNSNSENASSIPCNVRVESSVSSESNSSAEGVSSNAEDLCSNEIFNSIASDLEKLLSFYKSPLMKKKTLFERIKQSWFFIIPVILLVFITSLLLFALMTSNMTLFYNILEIIVTQIKNLLKLVFYPLMLVLVIFFFLYSSLRVSYSLLTQLKYDYVLFGHRILKYEWVLNKLINIKTHFSKFDDRKEIKAYALYLLGYFCYKFKDCNTAKEELQECLKLRPSKRIGRAAKDLLTNIWNQEIRPAFWDYWFNSPVRTWRRRVFGFLVVVCILSILFVHIENTKTVTCNDFTARNLPPIQINVYPYIISYQPNSISSDNTSRNNEFLDPFINNYTNSHPDNNINWSILIPTEVNIYPKIPVDNTFDTICLLLFILILIYPSIRIKEALQFTLNRSFGSSTLGLETTIEAPPKFNFELPPSHMYSIIEKLN